jgi:hypothetical protein
MKAELPDVRADDGWRFATIERLTSTAAEQTRRVIEVTDERIVCDVDSTSAGFARGRFVYTREWNLVSRPVLAHPGGLAQDVGRWRWRPHYPQFSFPLVAGKTWHGQAVVENTATGTRNLHRYRARVLDARELVVGAGTFVVLPVRYEAQIDSDDGEQRVTWMSRETLDYAPAANLFVRAEFTVDGPDGRPARDSTLELIAYRRR